MDSASENWNFNRDFLIGRLTPDRAATNLNSAQAEALVALTPFLADGTRSYIEMPPGSGKTCLFLPLIEILYKIAASSMRSAPRVLILTYSNHLRSQIVEEAAKFAPSLVRDAAILELDEGKKLAVTPVMVATYEMAVGLLKQRALSLNDYDLLIKDEGHSSLSELRHELMVLSAPDHTRRNSQING